MKIEIKDANGAAAAAEALILPITEGAMPDAGIDKALGGVPGKIAKGRQFGGKAGKVEVVRTLGRIKAGAVIMVGLGPKEKASAEFMRRAGGAALRTLRALGMQSASLSTSHTSKLKLDPADFAEGMMLAQYEYTRFKKSEASEVKSLTILGAKSRQLSERIRYVSVACQSVSFARDLINAPARNMTPTALYNAARGIKGIKVKALDRKAAAKAGLESYLSVAGGSKQEPRFIVAAYNNAPSRKKPIVLIGKSITFDSGGLSLKPWDNMSTMKYDMAGGAAVLGVLRAAVALRLKLNIAAILPACENLPGGDNPVKPGDVVRGLGGKTIEILNTDAEGRLALVDAISYAQKHLNPGAIIDIATLTGACAVALGGEAMGLMGNDEALIARLRSSGDATFERAWPLPLYDEYGEYVKSEIADMKNISTSRTAGVVTAGYILKEFAGEKIPWAHLDIAGTAWAESTRPYGPKGATAIGVRLLLHYLTHM